MALSCRLFYKQMQLRLGVEVEKNQASPFVFLLFQFFVVFCKAHRRVMSACHLIINTVYVKVEASWSVDNECHEILHILESHFKYYFGSIDII